MFTATDVLKPEFVAQPLDKLWALISPLYMVDESQWLEQLLPGAAPATGNPFSGRKASDRQPNDSVN